MNIIQKIKHLRHKTYLCIYHHFPIQNNKILIWANNFHAYGDSPKYIGEYLLRNYPKNMTLFGYLKRTLQFLRICLRK